jgi:hypothetical protein
MPAYRGIRRALAKKITDLVLAAVGCLELIEVLRHRDLQGRWLMERKTGFQ